LDKLKGDAVDGVSEDDIKGVEKKVQAIHDDFIKAADDLGDAKKKTVESLGE
jgi:ribosome recycling factor